MNWTCESLNERIKSVAENMDYGTLKQYPYIIPTQYAGKSEQALLKAFQLESIEFKLEDTDEEDFDEKKEGHGVQSASISLKVEDEKARYVMYRIHQDYPTDDEIDKMDIDLVKKKMMKFDHDLKILSENQLHFAIDLKDEAKIYSQESQSQGEDDIYSSPQFLAKIDEIVIGATQSKKLASDLDQFDIKLKLDEIVNNVIADLDLEKDQTQDNEGNLEDANQGNKTNVEDQTGMPETGMREEIPDGNKDEGNVLTVDQ